MFDHGWASRMTQPENATMPKLPMYGTVTTRSVTFSHKLPLKKCICLEKNIPMGKIMEHLGSLLHRNRHVPECHVWMTERNSWRTGEFHALTADQQQAVYRTRQCMLRWDSPWETSNTQSRSHSRTSWAVPSTAEPGGSELNLVGWSGMISGTSSDWLG